MNQANEILGREVLAAEVAANKVDGAWAITHALGQSVRAALGNLERRRGDTSGGTNEADELQTLELQRALAVYTKINNGGIFELLNPVQFAPAIVLSIEEQAANFIARLASRDVTIKADRLGYIEVSPVSKLTDHDRGELVALKDSIVADLRRNVLVIKGAASAV